METIQDRIFSLIGKGEIAEVARKCGISESTLRSYRRSMPGADALVKIAKGLGVSLVWLATGEGTRDPSRASYDIVLSTPGLPLEIAEDIVLVRKFDVQASAGAGAIAIGQGEEGVQFMALQASWLRSRNINPDFCELLTARGDSMEPTIRDGDTMIIDTSIDRARDNHIYVLVFDGMVLVKRFHKKISGGIVLMSDNPLYPPEEIAPADVPNLHIAGRLVWAGRFY